MEGTFRPGDILLLEPVALPTVRSGDVIAFCFAEHDYGKIGTVHRVLSSTLEGLVTKGDSELLPDQKFVTSKQLIGRVRYLERHNKVYPVLGGAVGWLWGYGVRLRRFFLKLGRILHRWLHASGLVRHLWHPSVVSVTLTTEHGPKIKYLCRGQTVAVWNPETGDYWCRKPYDLVLEPPATNCSAISE